MVFSVRTLLLSIMAILAVVLSPMTITAGEDQQVSFDADNPFQPSDDMMADVDAALAEALAEDKLALIIMGANWCHDSRGLLDNFADPELATLLGHKYQTLLVDVGNLERGEEVISRFGMPVIYGTPTVLIVDPKTGKLINKDTMFKWRDAASIGTEETLEYFSNMKAPEGVGNEPSSELQALYAQIDAFEIAQADRIYRGFEVIGPMLGMEEQERPDHFLDYWHQLSELRYTITDDLAALRAEATARVSAGEENIALAYPEYPAFDWE